MTPAVQ
jgi:transposase